MIQGVAAKWSFSSLSAQSPVSRKIYGTFFVLLNSPLFVDQIILGIK